MEFGLPDRETEFGARVADRLRSDMVGWLTTVDQTGMPAPTPVWFLWTEADQSALVYSQPTAKRLARMHTNPRATLHLNDDGEGHDYLVLSGQLISASGQPPANENSEYVTKYSAWMSEVFGSAEQFATMFSEPVFFVPQRIRGH